ncbi:MAG: GNAT family N-acetyltransferase [Muribaculaceae bacterium]|nr:GNAT family N-acetyltransferase [Muribaculaceae bacterium]
MECRIVRAVKSDAADIAETVLAALHVAEDDSRRSLGKQIFTALAGRDDSQYSYVNTLKAVASDGAVLGMLVGYDGGDLCRLREAFYEEVERSTGKNIRYFAAETDDAEWYIDSLSVRPESRGKGVASALIKEAVRLASSCGKPVGLLVDKDNDRARRLYESLGFQPQGERPFAGIMMDHLVRPLDNRAD